MKIEVMNVPDSKADKDVDYKYEKIVEDRSNAISKRFGMESVDIRLKLFYSKGALVASLGPNDDGMGVYAGYPDGSNDILLLHPESAVGLLEDIDKELGILIDFCLTKLYLWKKYYPNREDFKLYYKYVSDSLARFSAGNYRAGTIRFDIKMYREGTKLKKDQELNIVFQYMFENSGLNYIYEHLDKIMEDCDIKKTLFTIYKKTMWDIIKPEQAKILEEDRKKMELEKAKRQAARDKARNASN